jgi:hypothetical protein
MSNNNHPSVRVGFVAYEPSGVEPSSDTAPEPKAFGLTFSEWLDRSGTDSQGNLNGEDNELRAAWLAGESPEDYR